MDFKLIVALVSDDCTDKIIEKARELGATGSSVITSGRGEGLKPQKTFLGMTLEGQIDMVLFIVEKHLSRDILEAIAETGKLDTKSGSGVAMQLDIEDAVGLKSHLETIEHEIEDQI